MRAPRSACAVKALVLVLALAVLFEAAAASTTKTSRKNKNSSNKNNNKSNNNKKKTSSSSRTSRTSSIATTTTGPPPVCDPTNLYFPGNTQTRTGWLLRCTQEEGLQPSYLCRLYPTQDKASPCFPGSLAWVYDGGASGIVIKTVDGKDDLVFVGNAYVKGGPGYCKYPADYEKPVRAPSNCGINGGQTNQCGVSHADVCLCRPTEVTFYMDGKVVDGTNKPEDVAALPCNEVTLAVITAKDDCGRKLPVTRTVVNDKTGPVTVTDNKITGSCGVNTVSYSVMVNGEKETLPYTYTITMNDAIYSQTKGGSTASAALCSPKTYKTECGNIGSVEPTGDIVPPYPVDCKVTATFEKATGGYCPGVPLDIEPETIDIPDCYEAAA
jgi:hypothetical protein